MISKLKILLGKDGFRKNDLLSKIGLKGMINEKIEKEERLEKGREVIVRFPKEFIKKGFYLKRANFELNDIVDYEDVLFTFTNGNSAIQFESFYSGRLTYIFNSENEINSEVIIAKIRGI